MGFEPARAATIRVDPDSRYCDARTAQRLLRRGAAPGEGDARRRERRHHRCAAARTQPHLGRAGQGRHLRARPRPVGVRARRQRRLSGGDGHSAARRPRHRGQRHGRPASRSSMVNETMARDAVARAGSDRQDTCSAPAPRSAASSASSATSAISRSSRRPATRCTCRCASAAISRLPISWCARRCRRRSSPARFAPALQPIAANLPGNDFRTLQQLVDKSVSPRRFLVLLLGGFAVFALVLASLGIYGLISYSVNQRTQEIGIRMALGASARDVQTRIIAQTLRLAAIGMVLGTAASWAMVAGRRQSLLFGVTPRDPGDVSRHGAGADDRGARSPATCRRGARRGSIRWWRCGPSDRSRFQNRGWHPIGSARRPATRERLRARITRSRGSP